MRKFCLLLLLFVLGGQSLFAILQVEKSKDGTIAIMWIEISEANDYIDLHNLFLSNQVNLSPKEAAMMEVRFRDLLNMKAPEVDRNWTKLTQAGYTHTGPDQDLDERRVRPNRRYGLVFQKK